MHCLTALYLLEIRRQIKKRIQFYSTGYREPMGRHGIMLDQVTPVLALIASGEESWEVPSNQCLETVFCFCFNRITELEGGYKAIDSNPAAECMNPNPRRSE